MLVLAFLVCVILGGSEAAAQQAAAPRSVEGGRQLFATSCKVCHGEAGVGSRAPALRGEKFTVPYVKGMVTNGKTGTLMPKFAPRLGPDQIEGLAQYVVSLQQSTELTALRGNAAAGREVFFDAKLAHSCHVCHSVKGEGGRVGPELTAKLARRTPRDIFQRIVVVPHKSADPAYLKVAITTKSGQRFEGIRAEGSGPDFEFYDTSSLPPVLRMIPKSEIVSSVPLNNTVMPSDYAARLSLQQLLDLVAFLSSQGKAAPKAVTLADVIEIPRPGAD